MISQQMPVLPQRPAATVEAASAFQDAWSADPRRVVAGLNLAEALASFGQRNYAADQARRVLDVLDEMGDWPPTALAGALHTDVSWMRVEWERAAAGDGGDCTATARVKAELVRLRLQVLLGDVTGDPLHYYAACVLRPDLPAIRASLGMAVAKQNRAADALPHLEAAVRGDPFDVAAARVLQDVLTRLGLPARLHALARARRALHAAAPDRVPAEPWFAEPALPNLDAAPVAPPLRVVWQGAQEKVHSLAMVNRGLCAALVARGHELSLRPQSGYEPAGGSIALPEALAARKGAALAGPPDVHVMHQWPPDFTRPPVGRWVLVQPWEFGSIPKAWLGPLRDRVDELWVPSNFVRHCFIEGGVPAAKVHVVPNGVADIYFREDLPALPLRTRKRFKFLFVGGTLSRKGFDMLLKSYGKVFSAGDDVCLVVKDMGAGTFYHGQNAPALIAKFRQAPTAPEVEYIADELSDEQMAGLYRACDCVVQPYRGEGFCLPVAEAMACARPVIVTGFGPSLDYCTDETAYLLPYQIERLPEKRIDALETVDFPFLAQPSHDALRRLLRYVVEHPEEARARGARARVHVKSRLTWAHAAAVAECRMAALRALPAPRRPKTTLMMIVRNEEKNLRPCLASVAGLFDEIVITDTGSTDGTVAIAREFGAKVQHFQWIDNFAAARDVSLEHATGEWLFWMDADDRFDDANREKLRQILADLPPDNVGYVINCRCMAEQDTGNETVVKHMRLFRNHPGMKWAHRIHEQILPALRLTGVTILFSDLTINHVGYQEPGLRARKLERDMRILLLEHSEMPNHPFTLFNLANAYRQKGDTVQALDYFRKSLAGSAATDSIVSQLYATIAQCERELKRPAEAVATCRLGRTYYPEDAEILFTESLALHDLGELAGAIAVLERLIGGNEAERFTSRGTGLRGHKARHNLGTYYKDAGREEDAVAQWRLALAEQPAFLPPLFCLGDSAVARRDWAGLGEVIARLRALPQVAVEAEVFRARAHQARGEFAAALALLDTLLQANPRLLSACIARANVLVEEGRDWVAAEQALRTVLELAPQHAETRRKLDLVLRRLAE
jgi:glycosyltransferase involved in cell wall biosynthesis/tetratricopeptide (TPR) repeat protein